MTTAYPGCSKTAIEYPQMDSSEDTKESESEQEKEMAKDSRKEKLSRASGAANQNPSEGQNGTDSSNSGGPTEVPIINDNQASTSSNPLVAELQETRRDLFRQLNAKNEETQMVIKTLTKAQLVTFKYKINYYTLPT